MTPELEGPWRREWQPTPVFLLGESHGQRSLEGCNPWGRKESDMTDFHFFLFQDIISVEVVIRQFELGNKVKVGKRTRRPLRRADLGGFGTGGGWRTRRN